MKKQWFLICLFSLLLVSSALAAYNFYNPSGAYGAGFGDLGYYFETFLDFLEQNEYVIDAIVFLVIFLVFAKKVFKEKFEDDKILYIVIGVALTIGIMMYERRVGYSFIINSGIFAILVLFMLAIYILSQFTKGRLFLTCTVGLVAMVWLAATYPDISYAIPPTFLALATFLLGVGWIIGGYQLIKGGIS